MRFAGGLAVSLLLVAVIAGVARGETAQSGNVIVGFDGGISPSKLPRDKPAPVAVSISTDFRAVDGADPPPQLREIEIGINRGGKVFDRGLPTCEVGSIQPTTIKAARRICGGAIVGSGKVTVRVSLTNQAPFTFTGPMLVFNAKPVGGKRRLLAQVYGSKPPSAFVIGFKIDEGKGEFGTVIRTRLPKGARKWAHVMHFEMKLRRIYRHNGKRRSFVSASCSAPAGWPGALFPFARAKFGFAGGQRVVTTLVRECSVR